MTFQWYWLLGCFVVGLLIGAVLVRKFGTDWLSMLAWLVGKDEIAAIARIVWDAGLIPTIWKQARFQNDVEKFVVWVMAQWELLAPDIEARIMSAARSFKLDRR